MSVTAWKRTLTLLNIAALLGMAGTVYGYMQHRSYLEEPAAKHAFAPEKGAGGSTRYPSTDAIAIALGAPYVEPDKTATKIDTGPKVAATGPVMKDLFKITSAVAVEPPYDPNGPQPTLVIEFLKGGESKTIRLGQAIEGRLDDKRLYLGEIPVKYKFIGCRADKLNPYLYHFWFDVFCDGKNLQSLKWIGRPPEANLPKANPIDPDAPIYSTSETGSVTDVPGNAALIEVPEGPGAVGTGEVPDVIPTETPSGTTASEPDKTNGATDPKPKPSVIEPFEAPKDDHIWTTNDKGVYEVSERGLKDLRKKGFKGVLKNVKTKSYKGPDGKEGIRIARMGKSSPARGFGIREEDVILSINNRSVKNQRDAVRVVKDEINNRKKNILTARILRGGKEITLTFDTRDPKSRREAIDYAKRRR